MHAVTIACRYSHYLARQIGSGNLIPRILKPILDNALTITDFQTFADWQTILTTRNQTELVRQLRLLRRYTVAQIIIRDLNHMGDLNEVTHTITRFADFAVNTALDFAYAYYRDRYGTPIGSHSREAQHLSVVAMGKAGGYELNVSSDLDLIFIYPEAGNTDGTRSCSNQEFFTLVGRKLIALLNDTTDDGQVFRIDMRLRPDGESGALVLSETALEQYLIQQGREWERYAWCKARVVTPHPNNISALVRPFVFRKYLDFNAYDAMRGLHRQIRREVTRKHMENNIKLGAGGIREIEFTAQIFQMIRGGRIPSLQLKGTQETLKKLADLNILEKSSTYILLEAYRFLRDVEHRLQYRNDQQTQTLPHCTEQQQLLAESMGFDSYAEFSDTLDTHRNQVNTIFNQILAVDEETPPTPNWQWIWQDNNENRFNRLQEYGFDAAAVDDVLNQLQNSAKYRQLSAQAQPRFDAAIPLSAQAAAATANPTDTLLRLLDFLKSIGRRYAYLAFLNEHPQVLKQLADIMSQSRWVADYLTRYPILIDELLSAQLMDTDHNWQKLAVGLSESLNGAAGDTEAQMDILRHFHHTQTFRLAVQDLAGLWSIESLSDQLSALADTILSAALPAVWTNTPKTHTDLPRIAVIGYGKLGGKELGYTSDLDLVYLYSDPHPNAADIYSRFIRRLSNWLSATTGAGTLYDIDLRLRPNGDSGFLIHSSAAFQKYQYENAQIWEHQALTRARFICGNAEIGHFFDTLRRQILTRTRSSTVLKQEIICMREKISATHPAVDSDIKYARGGVVDVEFIVQYLILAHAAEYPQLLDNYGNIALLDSAAQAGLINRQLADKSRTAYRFYRHCQHNTKLRDIQKNPVTPELLAHYQNVRCLWVQVFGESVRLDTA